MIQLSRTATLGLAKETTQGTYVVPTVGIPFKKADFEDTIGELRDESVRGDDTVLHGMYQGVWDTTWSLDIDTYPDLLGHFFRAVVGPDTVTAATSTTLSASYTAGGASLSTAASIPAGTTIQVDTGVNVEYAITGTPTGTGPYTIPITSPAGGLSKNHASATAVTTQTLHTFKQNPAQARPSYSLTVYDTIETLGYPGQVFSDLQLKIDPKAALTASVKSMGWPAASQSSFSPSYTPFPPFIGWEWALTCAGATSTRGLSLDLTIKRQTEAIHGSSAQQGPREVFAGALEADGTLKAIYENNNDINQYLNYSQLPLVAALTQPVGAGGCVLTITMTKSGWYKGKRDLGQPYVQADFSVAGIFNSTDTGALAVTLSNFITAAY